MSNENQESLKNAMQTLNQLATSHSTPKNFKKTINELMIDLKSEEYSISVRAANAISSLDDITQNPRSEEHTSELQSLVNLVCRLLLEKKKNFLHMSMLPTQI